MSVYLQSVLESNSGARKTNPCSVREESLNPGLPAYKSSALTTRPPTKEFELTKSGK